MSITSSGSLPLHYLVRRNPPTDQEENYYRLIKMMMESGAGINSQNNFGETPLHGSFIYLLFFIYFFIFLFILVLGKMYKFLLF